MMMMLIAQPLYTSSGKREQGAMITRRPWFGPKRGIGWGWTPVSWQGWLVTALSMAVVAGAYVLFGPGLTSLYVTIGSVAALTVVCVFTGTRPG